VIPRNIGQYELTTLRQATAIEKKKCRNRKEATAN
jgi:hypothetical protein